MNKKQKKAVENVIAFLSKGNAKGFSSEEASGAIKAIKVMFDFDDNLCRGFDKTFIKVFSQASEGEYRW